MRDRIPTLSLLRIAPLRPSSGTLNFATDTTDGPVAAIPSIGPIITTPQTRCLKNSAFSMSCWISKICREGFADSVSNYRLTKPAMPDLATKGQHAVLPLPMLGNGGKDCTT